MAETRRCIGSERYGIDPHEAPVDKFPKQPSQRDGLGRMCKPHWNQYTAGLARDRKARQALDAKIGETATERAKRTRVGGPAREAGDSKAATKRERRRTPMAHVSKKRTQRQAEAPAKAERVTGETPAVTARRKAFEKRLTEVGVGSEEGQRMLESRHREAKRDVVSEIRELAS